MTYFRYPGSLRIGVRNEPVPALTQPLTEAVLPKQMLLVLLNGHQRFRLAGTEFLFSTIMPEDPGPKALLLRLGCESQLEYLESQGLPLVKVAISTDPDWLDQVGQDESAPRPAPLAAPEGLSHRLWTPDAELIALAQSVVDLHRDGTASTHFGDAGNLVLMSRAIELYRLALTAVARVPARPRATTSGDPVIGKLAAYIATRLDDATLGPETLARGCGLGLRSLQRLCRRQLDCSPRDFIRAQRMEAAFIGLRQGGMNVALAAHIAGYASTTSFSTAFKREFGMTPACAQHRTI